MAEDVSAAIALARVADDRRPALRFWLLVVAGPDTGATCNAGGERTVIGTHEAADLVLHDSTVSRFHCEILGAGERPLLRDLSSLNGSSVNGVGVVAAHLHSGATITVGRTHIRFDLEDAPAKLAAVERGLGRAASADGTVLLEGERGAATRAAAEAVHAASARGGGPLVIVDCAALPGELLERELFGEDGAPGAFEAANGGTLFLAEVGELPLELQPKLLRALEKHEVKRGGGSVAIDVRVIAATSRNLRCDVNSKKLRSDLYGRLAAHEVRLRPPPSAAVDGGIEGARRRWVAERERRWLAELVERHDGDVASAARAAAVEVIDFTRLLRRHGVS